MNFRLRLQILRSPMDRYTFVAYFSGACRAEAERKAKFAYPGAVVIGVAPRGCERRAPA